MAFDRRVVYIFANTKDPLFAEARIEKGEMFIDSLNKDIKVKDITTGEVVSFIKGNTVTAATKLSVARNLQLGGDLSGSVSFDGTGDVTINAQVINDSHDHNQTYYTKDEIDGIVTGLDFKESVTVATTANITLSGLQTIDNIPLTAGNRVLVKNQTTASQNGIYIADTSTWARSDDANSSIKVSTGMYCFVEQGLDNESSGWVLSTTESVSLGTTPLAFTQFNGLGQITAGSGLTKIGNTLNIGGNAGRIITNADNIDLATTGVASGTYRSVTTDNYGRITAGTNPTTLAEYGLTDAQALNANLTSLSSLSQNGILVKTLDGSITTRSIVAASTKITMLNADGISGNMTIDVNEADIQINNLNGTLSVGKGGTGNTTLSGMLKGNGTSAILTAVAGTDYVSPAGSEILTNKTLTDSTTNFQDETDNTKKMKFELSGIATGNTRVLTVPNVSGTIVTTGDTGSITSAMIADGAIVNGDISASAGIVDTKLATISTSGKVSNSATTATSSIVANTIMSRDSWGNSALNELSVSKVNSYTITASALNLSIPIRDANGVITATSFSGVNPVQNNAYSNLGSPSVEEMALFHGQMVNRFRFTPPSIQEESADGISWSTSTRLSSNQLGDIMIGEGQNTLSSIIPAGSSNSWRITWDNAAYSGYIHLRKFYAYIQTSGFTINITIEIQNAESSLWSVLASGNTSGWPTHAYIPHTNISLNTLSSDASKSKAVRVTFNTTNTLISATGVLLGAIEWFGGYPAGKRNVELYDRDRNVVFPNNITSMSNLYGQRLISTIATGTAPFQITSTTVTPNLNADLLDGQHAPTGTIVGTSDTQTLTNKTIGSGSSYSGGVISPTYGGTGVNNGSNTFTLGGNLVFSGSFAATIALTGATSVTLPTSGTIPSYTEAGTFTNKTLTAPKISSGSFIADANGNESIRIVTTPSAVNDISIANSVAGQSPSITATGDDVNIGLKLMTKGTGSVSVNGTDVSLTTHNHDLTYEPKNTNIQTHVTDTTYHLNSTQKTDLTDGGDSTLHYHATDRARANHTGTQTASTISDFNEAAQDAVGYILTDTSSINFTYDDALNQIKADAIFGSTVGTIAEGNHIHSTFDRASSVMTGDVVLSDIVVVDGIITDIVTRALTAGNIGAMATTHPANAITGFGGSGTATTVSRSDHTHSYQPLSNDLTAIDALAETTGFLKKTALDTWVLDTAAYTTNLGTVTSIATSGAITGGTITSSGTISHSTADGFLHVPATGTTNNGKVLGAGATAGSIAWVSAGTGTVLSVSGVGTVSGLTLSGTVTDTGSLTLGGTLSVVPSNFASQTGNTILAAPSGSTGVPTFRALVALDIPNLDVSKLTTGTLSVARGGTGVTTSTGTGSVVLSADGVLSGSVTFDTLVAPDGLLRLANTSGILSIGDGTGSYIHFDTLTRTMIADRAITGVSFNLITGLASVAPLIDGTAAVGTSTLAARQDHKHPTDTTRAATNQTMYIGTTAVTINRASATLALAGITLDAATITSGVIAGSLGVDAGNIASSFVAYNGTTATNARFDGGTTTPTGTQRLNYGGYFYPTQLNLVGTVDTTDAATHYFVETATDGTVRPKTLADVKTEIVTKAAVEASGAQLGTNIAAYPFTATEGQTVFATGASSLISIPLVFLNGVLQIPTVTYTVNLTTKEVTFVDTRTAGDSIVVFG